jgi:mono/diheme cytochrome c family protein
MRNAGVVLALLALAGCAGKYIRPLRPDFKVQSTPEKVARGEYLVNSAMACGSCHTGRDPDVEDIAGFLERPESTAKFLGGGGFATVEAMNATIWMPNLTPDPETGLGKWTDDEIVRAIRDGVNRDGRLMIPMMPFSSYQYVSDADMEALVAYLRSIPPIKSPRARVESKVGGLGGFLLARGIAHHKPVTEPVAEPDKKDPVKYGEYVMRLGHCWECHSGTDTAPREPDDALWMAGGRVEEFPELGKVPIRNLTPDPETGLGKFSAEQIKAAIRNGTRLDGKKMAPPMSLMIPHWSTMSDEDLDALVAYLKALKPAKNAIPERELTADWKKRVGE